MRSSSAAVDRLALGQHEVEPRVVGHVGHARDLLGRERKTHRHDRLDPAQRREGTIVVAAAVAEAKTAPVERGQWNQQQVRLDRGRLGGRLPDPPQPGTSRSPNVQARKTSGVPRPCTTGRASGAPWSARRRIRGTGLISLRMGEKPDTTMPGKSATGNPRAASASAAAARSAAGKASRRARAAARKADFSVRVDEDLAIRVGYPKGPPERKQCGAAEAVGALDPRFPTKVGGRHMSEPTSPVRDSSLRIDKAPGNWL